MHGLVAGLGDLTGDLLALGGEVELLRVPAAQLIGAHPQAVAAGLARDGHEVGAGGQRRHQLVHGGARQLELADDVRGGQRAVPVQEQLEYVESPGHGGYESPHGRPPL